MQLKLISAAKLPTRHGVFDIQIFLDTQTGIEHVALTAGVVANHENVVVRIHSECLTGDVFGSLRCDCGEQLHIAQKLIAENPPGVIIYLRGHEGRGIGLSNKIHAYALQDRGYDTVEANVALGLPIDSRNYGAAIEILKILQIGSVRLLTNNPRKVEMLQAAGLTVTERLPIKTQPNQSNYQYLAAKGKKLGHYL
ncbi:MAG: GTP cyclohydrolase II [Pseudomonadota bacterium]